MQTLLYWFGKCVVLFTQALPLTFVAGVGRICGGLVYFVDARHRVVAVENLRLSFPEKSRREIDLVARENFRRIGEAYASAIKTAGMSFEAVLSRCRVIGAEKLSTPRNSESVAPSNNRIVAIGHFGNFELYTTIGRFVPGYRGATTYRALKQPGFDRLLLELRERSGCLCFERRTQAKDLIHALSNKGIVLGLLSDQHAGAKGVWAPFFGRVCSTTPAAAVFALRYDSPLNTAIVYRVGLARWEIEVGDEIPTHEHGVARSVDEIMRDVNTAFEVAIRRDPANWFWVHKRWKPKPGAGPV
jgi:lauroyl/myristoyl acyltransferase